MTKSARILSAIANCDAQFTIQAQYHVMYMRDLEMIV